MNAYEGHDLFGSGMAWSIVSAAANMTDCASSAHKGKGKMPVLLPEIIELICDQVISDMRASKDGTTVRALMHSSVATRAKMIGAFKPVGVYLYIAQFAAYSDAGVGNRWSDAFLGPLEAWLRQLVEALSAGRPAGSPPPLPDSDDVLVTELLPHPEAVEYFISQGGLIHWCKRERQRGQLLRLRDASLALQGAMDALVPALSKLRVYCRARTGILEADNVSTGFNFVAKLHSEGAPSPPSIRHLTWNIRPVPRVLFVNGVFCP